MRLFRLTQSRTFLLSLVGIIAFFAAFANFSGINLMTSGHWTLDLVRYQEDARYQEWRALIASLDPIAREAFANQERLVQDLGMFSFINAVPHVFYHVFHIKGAALWFTYKIFLSLMGVGAALLVFLLASFFYGSLVGFIAALLMVFSPHFWIAFNVDSALLRTYNIFLSLAAIVVFIRFSEASCRKLTGWALAGIVWALLFVFFHIGSFMMPLVGLIYVFLVSMRKGRAEGARVLKILLGVLALGIAAAVLLQWARLSYFHLPFSASTGWFRHYWDKGAEASHSASGIILGNAGHLFSNLGHHISGVFINGKTPEDWHYAISPPGIPYSYAPLISLFFVLGTVFAIRERRPGDLFFIGWFFLFFFVYGFLIIVRQKNIAWEIPALFILSSRAVLSLTPVICQVIKKVILEKWINGIFIRRFLAVCLILGAALQGGSFIFRFLPKNSFFDNAANSGTYQVFRHLAKDGYSRKSKVMFTLPESTPGPIMMRVFSDGAMPVACLSQEGVSYPPSEEWWKKFEEKYLPGSDKILYCFMRYTNHAGNINYVTDDHFRVVLEKMHPDVEPVIINGLDGMPLWYIYKVVPGLQSDATQESAAALNEEADFKNLAPEPLSDQVIGSAFKALAKTFVVTLNIDSFKKANAEKLHRMNEGKFEKKMRMVAPYIAHLPVSLRKKSGLKTAMTRKEALEGLSLVTKPMLVEIIEAIPNSVIAGTFRQYQGTSDKKTEGNVLTQINGVWNKAMENSKKSETN